ncbi:hypothetical protein [Yoonia sp.]|uniref:hypothetical protein n=1 Tax=Yoonia sp. TaxID=2212373 RepID=UPI002E047AF5|nr:hypothetical protein [Yoonia sp.]
MAVVLETVARNAACDAVVDQLDGGTIQFQTSADAEVATLTLGTPAFGAALNGTATANAITADSSAAGGAITKAVFRTSAAAPVFTVSVTATGGGGDIELSSLTIGAGDTVSMSSYTHTQPA